ncbi:hypothetical protein HBI56_173970 [Parastagonospora nodorum]|nr:hypothetical protein HBI56_173970 [Parastagonospora nodorum]
MLRRSCLSRVDYRYIKRFLCKLFIEVIIFISLRQGYRVIGLSVSSLIIREKKEERKISKIYMPTSTSTDKYLFALLLTANILLPRELDRCNYYVKEASKPTLRAAN